MDSVDVANCTPPGSELVSLRRMAARVGVPVAWLREKAETGDIPGLRAGNRWLFVPEYVIPVITEMASRGETWKSTNGGQQ